MTGVLGGSVVMCGALAALAVADVPMAFVAIAAFGMLGLAAAWSRLRHWRPRAVAWRGESRVVRSCWTDDDRQWLSENQAALRRPRRFR